MDGGSVDDTISTIVKFENQISWVSESDRGQAHAINKGFQQSKGDILCYLNSDDAIPPGTLQHVGRFFRGNVTADVLYGRAQIVDDEDEYQGDYPTRSWDWDAFRSACFICQPAAYFRRGCWSQIGGFDQGLHGALDYDFWMRLYLNGAKFHHEEIMLGFTRYHSETKTKRIRPLIYQEIIRTQIGLLGVADRQWWYEYLCCLKWEELSPWGVLVPENLDRIRLLARALEFFVRQWPGGHGGAKGESVL